MKVFPSAGRTQVLHMTANHFWPLDYDDEEDEIYENLSWDLPGLKRSGAQGPQGRGRSGTRRRHAQDGAGPR